MHAGIASGCALAMTAGYTAVILKILSIGCPSQFFFFTLQNKIALGFCICA
jgi:hypothetical protein